MAASVFSLVLGLLVLVVGSSLAMTGLDLEVITDGDDQLPRAVLVRPFRDLPKIGQLTFCLWMHLNDTENMRDVNPVSYSSREAGNTNEVLLEINYRRNVTGMYINDEPKTFDGVPAPNKWTHVCASWTNQTGRAEFFFDGRFAGHLSDLKKGYVIQANGYMVLGQDQDWYDGGYSKDNGINGRITQFQFFDRALRLMEVKQVMDCQLKGNLIQWENSTWRLNQNCITTPSTAPCGKCSGSSTMWNSHAVQAAGGASGFTASGVGGGSGGASGVGGGSGGASGVGGGSDGASGVGGTTARPVQQFPSTPSRVQGAGTVGTATRPTQRPSGVVTNAPFGGRVQPTTANPAQRPSTANWVQRPTIPNLIVQRPTLPNMAQRPTTPATGSRPTQRPGWNLQIGPGTTVGTQAVQQQAVETADIIGGGGGHNHQHQQLKPWDDDEPKESVGVAAEIGGYVEFQSDVITV